MRRDVVILEKKYVVELTGIVVSSFFILSGCGDGIGNGNSQIESGSESIVTDLESAESPEFPAEPTIGDAGDFFAYADPSSSDAELPGVDLDEWVTAMEADGVAWLEQGASHDGFGAELYGEGAERWLGTRGSQGTVSAMVNGNGQLVEINCSAQSNAGHSDVADALRVCYYLIDAEGFDPVDLTEWIGAELPGLAEGSHGVATYEVFGQIWAMVSTGVSEHSGSITLRRAAP